MPGPSSLPPVPVAKPLPLNGVPDPERQIIVASVGPDDPELSGYTEWIASSLREFDEVEIVGVDPALANCVSVILILENSGIATRHELDTTTFQAPDKSPKSCIKVTVRRGPALVQELEQKQRIKLSKPKSA
ncbi:uncharacterized protein SPPG_05316 [Spizellomyces punctatus DAOM BR117]|uniref:Uncharacterized protein n=1 Tax=Spizellomyces punctatus (strain DAOM BR117) TaxID=645134 RepID=A0A0L0HGI0_SPIPD|nr:uncharacterized protein SPPG_05316 [Spizellomyces punctatus DAOM BR117]KNC99943.1 hypothetical protein SPPG_05316 [Spizellomyces punctatus DAOM BR117]|eukprot:XP_016607983.1 hypothetical protein SPPG_05316 [Spizellomyces punctatus DAOM BR117]